MVAPDGAPDDTGLRLNRRFILQSGQPLDREDKTSIRSDTQTDFRKVNPARKQGIGKPRDGFVSRTINRKLSTRLFTPLLMRLSPRVTPNQVSVLSFTVAVAASLSFFLRRPVLGGTLVQLASVLDGSDGEIARLKKMQSKFGDFLDAVLDRYGDSFLLFGMSYYALTSRQNSRLFGRYWTPLAVGTSMLAISGNLMVSYTSAKSVTNFGYRYGGAWVAAGRGRDLRLLILFLGGVLAPIHPVSVFSALLAVAVQTNAIVLRRLAISRLLATTENPLIDSSVKAIIYDFDGTIADTMPFLTDLAVGLIAKSYGLSHEVALERYRSTVGRDFRSQLEVIFPNHPENAEVSEVFEDAKRQDMFDQPIFPEVIPTLTFFGDRDVKQFLCSSTRRGLVEQYARAYGIDGHFCECLGFEEDLPKGAQIASVIERHRLDPNEVVFVTDSPHDVDYVKGTGLRFVGIQRLFSEQEFQARGLGSVKDLSTLTQLWRTSEERDLLVERV